MAYKVKNEKEQNYKIYKYLNTYNGEGKIKFKKGQFM